MAKRICINVDHFDDDVGDNYDNKRMKVNVRDPIERSIFEFLKTVNRPYSILDIHKFNSKFTRLQVTKTLTRLVDDNLVHAKHDNKIFWIDQVSLRSEISLVNEIQDNVNKLKKSLTQKLVNVQEDKENVYNLENSPPDDDLTTAIDDLRMKIAASSEEHSKLWKEHDTLRGNLAFSSTSFDDYILETRFYLAAWKARKFIVTDFVNQMRDSLSHKTKIGTLFDEIGIEADEAHGVLPSDIMFR